MRVRIALVTIAALLAPLAALGGSPAAAPAYPEVAIPEPVPPQAVLGGSVPHPCTPYAGCQLVSASVAGGVPPQP